MYNMLNNNNLVNDFHVTKQPQFKFKGQPKDDIDKAIRCFLTGNVGKFGNYVAVSNALVYRIITETNGNFELQQNVIAIKTNTLFIGNSSILPLIGRTVSFGNEQLNDEVTEVQTRLSQHILMLPFNVFTEAGLNLNNVSIIDKGQEETVIRSEFDKFENKTNKAIYKDVKVHFTGASLFRVDDKVFLFDIDRVEIKHKIFNPFLVELVNTEVKTIDAAYVSLKPQEVLDAETKGLKVLRQGEWFFIPTTLDLTPRNGNDWKGKTVNEQLVLKAGNNRPNRSEKYSESKGVKYVSGRISHSGREHKDLVLKGWYLPVPNTSTRSFTITGDVD